jgi:pimeloyl-ACP methyl ester carboxylesterase
MFKFINGLLNNLWPANYLHVAFDSGGKRKSTVILLHGIAATSKTWDPLIKELDTERYRVISMDLLGFGKSPMPKNCKYRAEDHVKHIHKTIKKLKVRRPYIIVGHSMGSIIAARYCLLYPKSVKELYLLSLPLYFQDVALHTNISRKQTDFYLNIYQYISQKKEFTITHSQRLRKLLRINDGIDVTEENWDSFRLSLCNTIIKQNTYDDIKNSKVPINIIYGALDQFMVQSNIDKLLMFNNVKITKLLAADHLIGTRFAKKVAEQISNSLNIV